MVRNPAVFLFDEPRYKLDAQLSTQIRLEIKRLKQRVGNTIIFVKHDKVEAMNMADRIVIMKDGHNQQVGTPAEVDHQPANTFVARFIGAPSMNLLQGKVTDTGVMFDGGQQVPMGVAALKNASSIILGVRPDDLVPNPENPIVSGKVTVREPLGPETLIYVETPSGEVIAKADGRNPPKVGDTVHLGAGAEHLHIFDEVTGEAWS